MTDHRSLLLARATTPDDDPVLPTLAAVAHRHDAPIAERLADLHRWLADDLGDLEAALGAIGPADTDRAWTAARHLLARPGKRIRPLGVILAARLGGRGLDPAVRGAAIAAELAHAATLLHDDVIDDGAERRGAPTARVVYGNAASVLGGDHLLLTALRRLDGDPRLTASLIDTLARMVRAEALQLERRRRFDPDRALYLDIVEGKTAVLFAWALTAGGHLAGLDEPALATLHRAGRALGMTFQLVDDLLDIAGDPALTGKDACADVREGKLTWPLLIASERDPAIALRLRTLAAASVEPAPADAAALTRAVQSTGALDETRREAERHAAEAHRHLAALPAGRARRGLETLVDAALSRQT